MEMLQQNRKFKFVINVVVKTVKTTQMSTQLLLEQNAAVAEMAALAKYDEELDGNPMNSDDAALADTGESFANVNQPADRMDDEPQADQQDDDQMVVE